MLKTRARFGHKDEAMSQCVDPVGGHTKAITNPLALGLLIGLKNNKCIHDSDSLRSPKSPLELRMLSTIAEPLFFLRSSLTCCGPAKVGLSIVGDDDDRSLSPDVVFGPALRNKHPKSLKIEKETETSSGVIFEIGSETDPDPVGLTNYSTRFVSRSNLGVSEDDLEEEYTCVIEHGPNPRTTHIYGGRVLECHQTESKGVADVNKEMHMFDSDILSVCNFCNKKLKLGEDIYMYRGEKAFCSEECRSEEMMMDEEDLEDSSILMHESLKKLF